ncbi:hypothetical protein PR048_027928 [Dryococelus australis]|uniref:RNA-directed DNA polymerase n=1 Tax=Dryococelus australis TaxID=614101 RepID=A0ABQ9GHX1_9NEOP|nr:hypothetical protein PR048_027928 [Dryococelus australis]
MPFGLVSAPEVFQQVMTHLLRDIDGTECSMDDILIHASTKAELEDITKKVILKLKRAGLKLNGTSSPDPAKVATIEETRKPTTIQELQRFLGMVNYLSKFIPNVSKLSTPLRQLLEKNVAWHWEHDPDIDASSHSVASVLLQENQPIAYASKALTKAQLNYGQIKKEALTILTACKEFHQYILGNKNLQIESDHKPLEAIFKNPLLDAPARLQIILFEVLLYSPTVTYVKGSQLYNVDALSRDCHITPEVDVPPTFGIHVLIPLSKECTTELQQAVDSNVIFKRAQTLIPSSMKGLVLSHLHCPHKGIIGTLKLARDHALWPGMTQGITEFVQKCEVCKLSQGNPTQERLTVEDIPSRAWMYVASDLFQLKGNNFLVIADSYSGYFDFTLLRSTTSDSDTKELKLWFSQHGIPDELRKDGGPQYSSHEFEKFRWQWNFRHRISSPHFPCSNSLAKRYVPEAKNLIRKDCMDDTDTMLALLHHRNTPRGKLGSPSQHLMGCRTRTLLRPAKRSCKPELVKGVKHNLKSLRQADRNTFNQNRTLPPPLLQGDDVLCREGHKHWVPKSCLYIIDTPTGRYRRNSRFIKPRGGTSSIYSCRTFTTTSTNKLAFPEHISQFLGLWGRPPKRDNPNMDTSAPKKIHSLPGKELVIPDALFQASGPNTELELQEQEIAAQQGLVVHHIHASQNTLAELQLETQNDETLNHLKTIMVNGWPNSRQQVPVCVMPYHSFRNELTVHYELVYKGTQIVVPKSMRCTILSKSHYNRMGIQKIKLRARECVFWPGINHKTSSPGSPQLNGLAERHVQTSNECPKKAVEDRKDIMLALLEYRNTPIENTLQSPAQLIFSRCLRGLLP